MGPHCPLHPPLCIGTLSLFILAVHSITFFRLNFYLIHLIHNICSFDFSSDAKVNSTDGSWLDANIMRSNRQYNSSSNSNSSSVSSISTSSSDSDYKTSGAGDLEADADSLMCRPSGLSSVDQSRNDNLKTVCFLYIILSSL